MTLSGWLRYDIIDRWLRGQHVESILEIGPGVGSLGAMLARSYDYVGVEADPLSARIAAARISNRGTILTATPEAVEGSFDLVCAFEVLEHIEDDGSALTSWRNRVRPGGWLALSVPAWQHRWGAHDIRAGHFRRYAPADLAAALEEAGYIEPLIYSYGFPLLSALHPIWNRLSARAEKEATVEERTLASGRFRQPPSWLGNVTRAVAAPAALAQRPFLRSSRGTGLIAFAKRLD